MTCCEEMVYQGQSSEERRELRIGCVARRYRQGVLPYIQGKVVFVSCCHGGC